MSDPFDASGLLPLVLGVAGHRDLPAEDFPALRSQVRAIIEGLRKECLSTPIWLLSPLALGADQLAAEVALECDVRLIVPLPMLKPLYEKDFATAESLPRFRNLLARADAWFELPLAAGNESEQSIINR